MTEESKEQKPRFKSFSRSGRLSGEEVRDQKRGPDSGNEGQGNRLVSGSSV